jgi:ferritin-like metal-binding protein YciE
MSMETPRDLFIHELSDTLSAEHIILKMLPVVAGEVDSKDLRDALREHEKETKQQIKNLEAAFKELGEKPEEMTCHGADGLRKEVDSFLKENPSPEILTLFAAGAAGKTEQYEIQSYTGLIDMAKLMGEKEVAKLLQENLKQEEAMAKRVEQLEKQLGKELIPAMLKAEEAAATAD